MIALSPSVTVTEKDLTNVVPAVATSIGGAVIDAGWGPVGQVTTISSENVLVERFGKPNSSNAASWFSAANFLAYANNLLVVRTDTTAQRNAIGKEAGTTPTAVKINNEAEYLNVSLAGIGGFAAKYPGALGNSITVSICDSAGFASWEYKSRFDSAPGASKSAVARSCTNDELHIIVIDNSGAWTGTANTVLEKFPFVSKASDARKEDGSTAYYKNVINNTSKYIWWANHPTGATGAANDLDFGAAITYGTAFKLLSGAKTYVLGGGVDDYASTNANKQTAFDLFNDTESLDVNLLICGKANASLANYVAQNVAEVRKDCVAFISPENITTAAPLIGTTSAVTDAILAYRALITASSYAVVDTGSKYQYDKYNDEYRWVPLNGDIAGLCARTDTTNDPWWSPAGLNRGQIKSVVKLGFNPRLTDRDNLYKAGVNPVVSFPGQGTVLFGDKTALSKPSAFDRINVRRLFIVLEKAIATASKYQLFEFNDPFTRAQFVGMVTPFLRDVQGRRGITDFKVVCDETNNTGEVIDTNRFIGDIYIKPARSINFIQLNFIATRTGVAFSEVAGA